MLVATKQTLVGVYVDSCYYYDYRRPLLEATWPVPWYRRGRSGSAGDQLLASLFDEPLGA